MCRSPAFGDLPVLAAAVRPYPEVAGPQRSGGKRAPTRTVLRSEVFLGGEVRHRTGVASALLPFSFRDAKLLSMIRVFRSPFFVTRFWLGF